MCPVSSPVAILETSRRLAQPEYRNVSCHRRQSSMPDPTDCGHNIVPSTQPIINTICKQTPFFKLFSVFNYFTQVMTVHWWFIVRNKTNKCIYFFSSSSSSSSFFFFFFFFSFLLAVQPRVGFGLLHTLIPDYPIFHFLLPSCSFHLSPVHLNFLIPTIPWPSFWSCTKWFPIGYNFDITVVCHSFYMAEPSSPLGFGKFYSIFTFN